MGPCGVLFLSPILCTSSGLSGMKDGTVKVSALFFSVVLFFLSDKYSVYLYLLCDMC